jgi:hypothetical protein
LFNSNYFEVFFLVSNETSPFASVPTTKQQNQRGGRKDLVYLQYLLAEESSMHTPHQYFGLPSSLNYSFRRNKAQYSNKQTPFYQHKRAPAVGSGSKAGANLQR